MNYIDTVHMAADKGSIRPLDIVAVYLKFGTL